MPTLSIVTANLNSGNRLAATWRSIIGQGVDDFEYLIRDGGSTDESVRFARQLAADHPAVVRLVIEPDAGVYDAFNRAIVAATGRYVYFMGAGDELFPGVLKKVVARLPSHNRAFIYGNALVNEQEVAGHIHWSQLMKENLCQQAIFYGRDLFQLCGSFDLTYPRFSDWEFNLRCFGDRRIRKQFLPILMARFEPGGISLQGDAAFQAGKQHLLIKHFGKSKLARRQRVETVARVLRQTLRRVSIPRRVIDWLRRPAKRLDL